MKNLSNKRIALSVLAALLTFSSITVWADVFSDADGVPRLIAYRGHLDLNGAPVNSQVEVGFRIYDEATAGTLLWGPETHAVTPQAGAFTVMLGETVDLPPSILVNGDAFVAVSVAGVDLNSRQRLGATPFALRASNGVPAGTVIPYAGASVPAGWLPCDGAAVSRAEYAELFAALGETYGAGDGSTTFNLPDLRGRTVVGAGQGAGLSERTAGDVLGEETHQLTAAEMPGHTHAEHPATGSEWLTVFSRSGGNWPNERNGNTAGNTTGSAGGDQPHNVMQPSLVMPQIIKH